MTGRDTATHGARYSSYVSAHKPPPLKELRFGHLDAGQEASEDPDLLLSGFYDYREAAYGITTGRIWLLLGPKGAGKSAVLEHLRLSWEDRWDKFFTLWDFRSFPVADVTAIKTGQSPGASRSQAAWEFLLLLRVIASLQQDEAVEASNAFHNVRAALAKSGLLSGDWKTKILQWSKASAKLTLPLAELGVEVASTSVDPLEASSVLKQVIAHVRSPNQHAIALDGLDSFFFELDDEWNSLAGLLHALEAVNRLLKATSLRVTVVAAVRADIFDILPSAETNKLTPASVIMDWNAFGIGSGNGLWHLVKAKAAVQRPEVTDIVRQYLAEPIYKGGHTEIATFFLDHTRLLPRDMVALMGYLKEVHPGASSVTEAEAVETVRLYSQDYFTREILNNLAGILPGNGARKVAAFRDSLRTVPMRMFSFDDVQDELKGELEPAETKALLKQLFEVGGIGVRNTRGSLEHTDFIFRRVSGAGFTTRHGFLLHNALTRAWNRPWK
jgi:hypothetical protein